MANKMLIDASHPEETRVVVIKGSRIEEFDFESEHKKQIKGNIYLAKVTRVEPSLQAAFVEYGGNRHGFLAFSEIHPDYYQIPVADRQALLEDELARAKEEEENEDRKARARSRPTRPLTEASAAAAGGESVSEESFEADEAGFHAEGDDNHLSENEHEAPELIEDEPSFEGDNESDGPAAEVQAGGDGEMAAEMSVETESGSGRRRGRRPRGRHRSDSDDETSGGGDEAEEVDQLGAEDAMEEVPIRQTRAPRKQYKIQEVIKRRQILLVQVVKEERGNKGAALTTYLSLAGRYSVLMPNTARGGGISRKITNIADRKRLKEVARELEVPRGMGIILRTAGAMRTKAEVKRDYEYLMRLWETVRNLTLSSTAPTLVYEEGSLVKRSIRDLYNKDIDQILVSGENGYREAKDFMRMLMPSQAKVVQPYRDAVPIFARGGIEAQLDKMLQPHVTLKSGGYIIINQTEALVAIDVNSGRSTREHSVEDTAFQTNMEAAEEVARQLRLRDLAGLIVIDFIDMEEKRNNRTVEKKVKDCLKDDRARIQVGRISHFGLMEMSRQRIRASVLESTTQPCPVCDGVGHIRSSSSLALHVVRAIEDHLQKQETHDIIVKVPTATALYVLNEKRSRIEELERHHGLRIIVQADDGHGHQHVAIEQGAEAVRRAPRPEVLAPLPSDFDEADDLDEVGAEIEEVEAEAGIVAPTGADQRPAADESADEQHRRKRRRRRRRGGDEPVAANGEFETTSGEVEGLDVDEADDEEADAEVGAEDLAAEAESAPGDDEATRARKRRRRGRRGGRRGREEHGADGAVSEVAGFAGEDTADVIAAESFSTEAGSAPMSADVQELEEGTHFDEAAAELAEAADQGAVLADLLVAGVAVDDSPAEDAEPAAGFEGAPNETIIAVGIDTLGIDDEAEPAILLDPAPAESESPAPVDAALSAPQEPQLTSTDEPETGGEARPKRTGWWARRSFF